MWESSIQTAELFIYPAKPVTGLVVLFACTSHAVCLFANIPHSQTCKLADWLSRSLADSLMASYCSRPHQAWTTQPWSQDPDTGTRSGAWSSGSGMAVKGGAISGCRRDLWFGGLRLSPLLDRDVDQSRKSCKVSHPAQTFATFALK